MSDAAEKARGPCLQPLSSLSTASHGTRVSQASITPTGNTATEAPSSEPGPPSELLSVVTVARIILVTIVITVIVMLIIVVTTALIIIVTVVLAVIVTVIPAIVIPIVLIIVVTIIALL